MKKKYMGIAILSLIGLVSSCAITFQTDQGRILPVNGDGQFKQDIVYQLSADESISFDSEGNYETLSSTYEGEGQDKDKDNITNEGWVLFSGDRGIYHYDPNSYIMTLNLSTRFGNPGGGNAYLWMPLTNATDIIKKEFQAAPLEHSYYANELSGASVLTNSGDNTWNSYYREYLVSGTNSIGRSSVSINVGDNTLSGNINYYIYDENNNLFYATEETYITTISQLQPDNIRWKVGETVTFHVITTSRNSRNYTGSTWSTWLVDEDQTKDVEIYAHMGDFIISSPATQSYRGISLEEVQ